MTSEWIIDISNLKRSKMVIYVSNGHPWLSCLARPRSLMTQKPLDNSVATGLKFGSCCGNLSMVVGFSSNQMLAAIV